MLTQIAILLSPFLQLGPSYYASVATIILLLTIVAWRNHIGNGALNSLILLACALFMPLSLAAFPSYHFTSDALRVFREAVMFILLVSAIHGLQLRSLEIPHINSDRPITIIVFFLFILTVIQAFAYSRGIYFGLPESIYALESGTFANELSLYYSFGQLRPHATFSEPSYLGFILLSLAMMILPRAGGSRRVNVLLAVIVVTGLLSRSLAFFLSITLIVVLPFLFERRKVHPALIFGSVVAGGAVLAFTNARDVLSRLLEARSGLTADSSTAARIFEPFAASINYLQAYPAGSPYSTVTLALLPFLGKRTAEPEEIMHNAFFNLIFIYGFVGIVLILVILFSARDNRVKLYLLACTMFNGGFLAIDKVAVIILALALYEGGKRANRSDWRMAQLGVATPRRNNVVPASA